MLGHLGFIVKEGWDIRANYLQTITSLLSRGCLRALAHKQASSVNLGCVDTR